MDSCVLSKVLNINPVSKEGIPLGAADGNLEIISSQRTCSWLFLQAFLLPLRFLNPLGVRVRPVYTANVHKRGSRWL